ncbi:cell wall-active antibiotics response protein LiaF [Agrilactobacillus fermenti]|uniref:cell wall-active antibiotics response protein LiaF n=1 Tax=Agrilactobacillus fermenti TaxID=2586909 RepID=UPI003A5BA272
MSRIWTVFTLMIMFVLAMLGWQIFTNPSSLTAMIIGVFLLLIRSTKKKKRSQKNDRLLIFGLIFMMLSLGQNISFWFLMLLIAFLMIALYGSANGWHDSKNTFSSWMPWNQKSYLAPEFKTDTMKDKATDSETDHVKMKRQSWFGNTAFGSDLYLWDDMNLSIVAGDTIVDLGNTLLPTERENIIIMRKGFGRTRILVPVGTKVQVNHSVFFGKLVLDQETMQLHNENISVTLDAENSNRELRIITNVWVGDLEVIYV